MKNKLEEIMNEISLFGFNNDRRIGTDVREIRKILRKHLQEPTEERECENCKKLQKELDGISFSM